MKARYLKILLMAVVLISLVFLVVKFLNFQEVIRSARAFQLDYLPAMFFVSIGYFLLKGIRFIPLLRSVDDLRVSVILRGYFAGLAALLIPGGVPASRAGFLKQAGVPVDKSSAPITISAILDSAGLIAGLLLSALWFQRARTPALILIGLLVVFGFLFLIPEFREWISNAAEWIAEKLHFQEGWEDFLNYFREAMNGRVLLEATGITVVAYILQVTLLDLSLRGINLDVPLPRLILAYFLPTVLGVLSTLPAGIGVTDATMVDLLASPSYITKEAAAAAVILFRLFTILLPTLLGSLFYFFGWHGEDENPDD